MNLPEPYLTYYRDTLELAIETSIAAVFWWWGDDDPDNKYHNIRDDCYDHYTTSNWSRKVAAVILCGLYKEMGCDMENLTSELLILDLRKRDKGRYPVTYNATIDKLCDNYKELLTSPSSEGEIFRSRLKAVKKEIQKRMEEFDYGNIY